jgi:hypothetical protein
MRVLIALTIAWSLIAGSSCEVRAKGLPKGSPSSRQAVLPASPTQIPRLLGMVPPRCEQVALWNRYLVGSNAARTATRWSELAISGPE